MMDECVVSERDERVLDVALAALLQTWSPERLALSERYDEDDPMRPPTVEEAAGLLVFTLQAPEPYIPTWVATMADLFEELDRLDAGIAPRGGCLR